ncbi:MAG TPA: response regulator [Pyrinomonadaceae bacterium]|nr:response regulator [Pyrinomonadaceae bacterium]
MKTEGGHCSTILIVEDIDWIRSGMRRAVEHYGYCVVEATNDAEAFALLERESPKMLLTEEKLPTFDALMARLHERPALRTLPVVIINPDAGEGARHGHAYLLTDYDHIASLLATLRP